MKKSYISLIILSGLCIVFSCSRENEMPGGMQERSISFRASAASEAESTLTKTSYGSVSAGNQTIEWTDGDKISLYSPHAVLYSPGGTPAVPATSYRLSVTVSGSTTVEPVPPEFPLMWGLTDPHVFVAKYPDPTWDTGENTPYAYEPFRSQSAASTDFLCYLPNTQPAILSSGTTSTYLPEMKYCYMTAYSTASPGPPSENVNLTFTPCVSAFEIIIPNSYNNAVETFTVKKVELISATKRLSGAYTVHLTDLSYVENSPRTLTVPAPVTEADRSVAVDFGEGVAVTSSNSLRFTVFTCPVDLDDLTIRVTLASDDQQTLELRESNTGDWLEFDAFKKYLITCGNVPDPYEFDVTTDALEYTTTHTDPGTTYNAGTATIKVISTKSRLGVPSKAPWKAQWLDGSTWRNMTSESHPTGVTLSQYTGDGDVDGEDITITVPAGDYTSATAPLPSSTYTFSTAPEDNSAKANAIDLSRYNFMDNTMESTYETANCYVIRAPGWYKFPLVYGNAVKGASLAAYQSSAYTNLSGTSSAEYMGVDTANGEQPFVDGMGRTISNTNTKISFTGTPGVSIVWTNAPSAAIESLTVEEDAGFYYVVFNVPSGSIFPSNTLIKVTEGETTVWSWHIWMVPEEMNLGEKAVYNHSKSDALDFYMLTTNLGQLPATAGTVSQYAAGSYSIRFVNTVIGTTGTPVTVNREAFITDITNPMGEGHCAFYQWGRKDPFQPPLPNKSGGSLSTGNANTLQYAMAHPELWLQHISNDIWTTSFAYNMWDTGGKYYFHNDFPTKSVYDPSPRGYCVSRLYDIETLNNNGSSSTGTWSSSAGAMGFCHFNTKYNDSSNTLSFPASGNRNYTGGYTSSVGEQCYIWSSSRNTYSSGAYFSLIVSSGAYLPFANQRAAYGMSVRPIKIPVATP